MHRTICTKNPRRRKKSPMNQMLKEAFLRLSILIRGSRHQTLTQAGPKENPSNPSPTTDMMVLTSSSSTADNLTVKAQFLVDEALHILHTLSDAQSSTDTPPSSTLAHYIAKLFTFLKSLSLIQYTPQEEPLSTHDFREKTVRKAMDLLHKAAEMDNPDALFLLGELNFVPTTPAISVCKGLIVVRKLFKSKLSTSVPVAKCVGRENWEFHCNAPAGIHVCHRNRKRCRT